MRERPMQEQIDAVASKGWSADQLYAIGYDRGFRAALAVEYPYDPVVYHDEHLDFRDPAIFDEDSDNAAAYGRGVEDGANDGTIVRFGPHALDPEEIMRAMHAEERKHGGPQR